MRQVHFWNFLAIFDLCYFFVVYNHFAFHTFMLALSFLRFHPILDTNMNHKAIDCSL